MTRYPFKAWLLRFKGAKKMQDYANLNLSLI